MTTTDQQPRRSWTTVTVGTGQESLYKRKEKSANLCNEEGCRNPIAYWLKFKSGHLGFYCFEHKERFSAEGRLVRIESALREAKSE